MAQRSVCVLLSGKIIRHERKQGEFTDREDSTRKVKYDYIVARLVTPDADAVEVRFPSDGSIPVPTAHDDVTLLCEVRSSGQDVRVTCLEIVTLTAAHARAAATS